jgi:hypothetical protein
MARLNASHSAYAAASMAKRWVPFSRSNRPPNVSEYARATAGPENALSPSRPWRTRAAPKLFTRMKEFLLPIIETPGIGVACGNK